MLYPNSFIDDDIIPRLTIFSIVPTKGLETSSESQWYNIFWNNYKISKIIDENIFNDENSDLLTKL
jgi:hypothetical protein